MGEELCKVTCPMCLPVKSIGRCARCGYYGPGPRHACPSALPEEFCGAHRAGPRFGEDGGGR